MSVYIEIRAEMSWEPTLGDLWPDGDAPETVDADVIAALIEKCGGVRKVLRDWNLLDDIALHVMVRQPNPAWQGDQVLFGEPPPRDLLTTAEVTS